MATATTPPATTTATPTATTTTISITPAADGERKEVEDVSSLLSSLRSAQTFDFLRIAGNTDLRKFLASQQKKGVGQPETVQFSDDVIKINDRGRKQTRSLVVTNRAVYNFTPKTYSKCNRRIPLTHLKGLCLSRSSDELVVQVVDSYDYRFAIRRRQEALDMISRFFETETKNEIPKVFSEEPELKDHVVTKEMQKKLDTQPASLRPEEHKIAKRKLSIGGGAAPAGGSPTAAGSAGAGGSASGGAGGSGAAGGGSGAGAAAATGGASSSSGAGAGAPGTRDRDEKIEAPKAETPAPHTMVTFLSTTGGARGVATHIEGWLTKKKGKSEKWERKFVVLGGESLQYFTPLIKGNMLISGALYIERIFANAPGNTKLAQLLGRTAGGAAVSDEEKGIPRRYLPNRFRVISVDKKDLLVAAETSAEMERWIAAFKSRAHRDRTTHNHIEGWLLRKDMDAKAWVKRYFVLIEDRLWQYEMLPKGTVDMVSGVGSHSAGLVMPTEEVSRTNFAGLVAVSRFAYRWNITDAERIFHMAADTEDDMKQWIGAVERTAREHTVGASSEEGKGAAAATAPPSPGGGAGAGATGGSQELSAEFVESVTQEAPTGQVTFVFTDVQSSTTLWEKVPDAMDESLKNHDRILREILKRFRGYEVKTEGDAFMVTFFSVEDAILWCLAVQEALFAAVWSDEFLAMPAAARVSAPDPSSATADKTTLVFNGIRIRMGIHTGEPNCRRNPVTGRMDYFGPVVNRSARVSDTAHGGQVVCTQEVFDVLSTDRCKEDKRFESYGPVTKPHGSHNLKGIPDPVAIYELLPRSLALRFFPPLRTVNNERKEKEEKKKAKEEKKEREGGEKGKASVKRAPRTLDPHAAATAPGVSASGASAPSTPTDATAPPSSLTSPRTPTSSLSVPPRTASGSGSGSASGSSVGAGGAGSSSSGSSPPSAGRSVPASPVASASLSPSSPIPAVASVTVSATATASGSGSAVGVGLPAAAAPAPAPAPATATATATALSPEAAIETDADAPPPPPADDAED